ncbi:hypothetical protein GIB67_031350 [Kingdonia uniflora]|uniref:Uncharacterized protein n=1 Tax=Kingdonia uniflora TaxID=39325 RepID=A0A7J7MSN1_9MAGN|nr:hypothetical protein GIB67_031350 [Kingdonia uniflora]
MSDDKIYEIFHLVIEYGVELDEPSQSGFRVSQYKGGTCFALTVPVNISFVELLGLIATRIDNEHGPDNNILMRGGGILKKRKVKTKSQKPKVKKVRADYLSEEELDDLTKDYASEEEFEIKKKDVDNVDEEVARWTRDDLMRNMVMEKIVGSYDKGYALCPELYVDIQKSNPSSIATCSREDGNPKFTDMCISFKVALDGFTKGCKPILGLDGCFLKGKYGGQCLSIISLDTNNGLFPIALFICTKMTTMENLIGLVNIIEINCTKLSDYGGDDEFSHYGKVLSVCLIWLCDVCGVYRNCDEAGVGAAAAQDEGGAGRVHKVSSYADFGTIVRLTHEQLQTTTLGSMRTLNQSLENLEEGYFEKEITLAFILRPRNLHGHRCRDLKLNMDDMEKTTYYMCDDMFKKIVFLINIVLL